MNSLRTKTRCHNFSMFYMALCGSLYTRVLSGIYWMKWLISSLSFYVLLFLWNILTKIYSFLVFLRGNDRLPLRGKQQMGITFRCPETFRETDYPRALTCHNILDFPKYSTMEKVEEALQVAINSNRGFASVQVTEQQWSFEFQWGLRALSPHPSTLLFFLRSK